MKTKILKFVTPLLITPLLLVSCSNSKAVKVYNNLDLYFLKHNEVAYPTKINGDQLLLKIDTKQDFVLYFHLEHCVNCEQVDKMFYQFLSPKNNSNFYPYQIYSYSGDSPDLGFVAAKYPQLVNEAPKISFFQNGQNVLTLASSRYHSYRTFSNSIREFSLKTNIYTATKPESYQAFSSGLNDKDYLVYIYNEKMTLNDDGKSSNSTMTYYHNNVYPYIVDSKVPVLLLSTTTMDNELKKTIYKGYDLDSNFSSYAIHKYNGNFNIYNYEVEAESNAFKEVLRTKF